MVETDGIDWAAFSNRSTPRLEGTVESNSMRKNWACSNGSKSRDSPGFVGAWN